MADNDKLLDHLYIKVEGTNIKTEVMDDLIEATVDTSLHLPDMFTIRFHDEELTLIDDMLFDLGKAVELCFITEDGTAQTLIKGEVTALEPEFKDGTQLNLCIRGYDHSHRLHRGTHSKVYLQVTDSDIAEQIAQENGLTPDVESTTEVYDHVLQHNQTHMAFLRERAQRIGYEFFVEDKTLTFRKPPESSKPLELEWGLQLKTFKPRLSLVEQVDEVTVKGWDVKTKKVLMGQADTGKTEPQLDKTKLKTELGKTAFTGAKQFLVSRAINSQAEADTLAQALLNDVSGAFIEAEGTCFGTPDLRAGKHIKLTKLGKRFSGTYLPTSATHIYLAGGGYTTHFTVNGRRPEGLLSLMDKPNAKGDNGRLYGPVVGVVTNNNDPEEWGRVKVKYPWLSEELESDWVRLVSPGAGLSRGFYALPEIDDEVLIAFEHGEASRPYVLGGLWNGKDALPVANEDALLNGEVRQRIFKTRVGHTLTFIDDGDDKGIHLHTEGGHKVTISDEKQIVSIETSGGHHCILDDAGSEISLKSTGNLIFEAGGNLEMKSGGNFAIESGGNFNTEATGPLDMKGATFALNADGMGEVQSSGPLTVKGAVVQIN